MKNCVVLMTMPARNEEATIERALTDFLTAFQRLGVSVSVQVIDDHSTDRTRPIAESIGAQVHSLTGVSGLASAFRLEMECALNSRAQFVVHADADGQHPAHYVGELLDKLHAGHDLILGTRLHKKPSGMSEVRWNANQLLSNIVSALAGVRVSDSQTGYRAMNRRVVETVKTMGSFTYTQEQIVRAARLGFRIAEVPIEVLPRMNSRSRLVINPLHYLTRVFQDLEHLVAELGLELEHLAQSEGPSLEPC